MRTARNFAAILEDRDTGGYAPWNRFQKSGPGRVGKVFHVHPTPPAGVKCKEDP